MSVYDKNGELNQEAIDVLYELGNVGVATAVMPIGNMREIKISVDIPEVVTVEKDLLSEISYDPEQIVVSVATKMNDTLSGTILFLLSKDFIKNTIYEMTEMEFSDEELLTDADSFSALQEIINYMTAGYAKVMGAYLNIPVYISDITIGLDKVSSIVEGIVEKSQKKMEKLAYVNTRFARKDDAGNSSNEFGQVLMFPDQQCIEKFIEIMED